MPRYTEEQGQYLAFIYYYTKIHGRSPSEAECKAILVLRHRPCIKWCCFSKEAD